MLLVDWTTRDWALEDFVTPSVEVKERNDTISGSCADSSSPIKWDVRRLVRKNPSLAESLKNPHILDR